MKVFGVGLSRTGTQSLSDALNILGIRCIHYPASLDEIEGYDAATDTTVAAYYKQLDTKYPKSKFVLTVRNNLKAWLESMRYLFEEFSVVSKMSEKQKIVATDVRMKLYGTTKYDTAKLLQSYYRHSADVMGHFKNRTNFLIMDICSRDGWDALCPFLDKPIPTVPFPHSHASPNGINKHG